MIAVGVDTGTYRYDALVRRVQKTCNYQDQSGAIRDVKAKGARSDSVKGTHLKSVRFRSPQVANTWQHQECIQKFRANTKFRDEHKVRPCIELCRSSLYPFIPLPLCPFIHRIGNTDKERGSPLR